VASIVENNLYGLDIDDRAAQLAYFAVMMKARQYDRRFFSRGIQPHVYAIVESNHVDKFAVDYFCNGDAKLTAAMETIISELHDAKEYGSILTVTPQDWSALYDRFAEIAEDINMSRETALRELLPLVQVAEALAQKYDAVVTNPPYMGASNMNPKLNDFIKNNYADYKSDFFSAFVIHCSEMAKKSGYCGFFTPYVWMFIQSYEKMRNYLYNQATIETLIQFEYSAFEEATVPVCTFAFQNRHVQKKGCYLRLVDFRGGMEVQRQKTLEAVENRNCGFYYEQSTDEFSKIPGSPVAYWVSKNLLANFTEGDFLKNVAEPKSGLSTTDNNRFLRFWHEVSIRNISFAITGIDETVDATKWFPIAKGGEYRKWYGNKDYVVNWLNNGADIKEATKGAAGGRIVSPEYYFKEFVTWSGISSGEPSMRISDHAIFGSGAKALLSNDGLYNYLAFLNSKVALSILKFLSPTLNYEAGHIGNIPVCFKISERVENITLDCIKISRGDWDSFETSWDFQHHPLLRKVPTIAEAFDQWQAECDDRFNQLKANEEELNRIFIDIYGLQDELTPEVEDKDVTVRKADLGRDIRSFISYAVGCMFGRYSLDVDGLAYAGGEWDASKYASFAADKDNIIPICDDEYFEDDIVGLFVKFVKTVYGADTLDENLKFVADALGGKGQPKDVIRNYFLSDFYSDHCKIYQKRPIYWLFDSGKKNGFKALIYMHRYQPDTIARIRTDYVHEQQARYRTAIADLEQRIANASTGERVKLNKKLTTLRAQDTEIRTYEEKIHHLADQMISIDLDDGVKKNYAIFQDVLAKIK
ncbi:BREX-1 system adenine-specific DNA-methyltransferase PglX, partial [[Ruminococcus] lactaris]|uniref:BREX-1 system adenine-specific DNA-methyltransferase PglX n=1 Tax=[Ruminococcus] lactaris TaxID=46228 RepID=UPI00307AB934